MLMRIIFWALATVFGLYAITNPHGAAALMALPFHLAAHAGHSLANFLN